MYRLLMEELVCCVTCPSKNVQEWDMFFETAPFFQMSLRAQRNKPAAEVSTNRKSVVHLLKKL